MKKNYDRYKTLTSKDCDKKTLMYYLCRVPSDRRIVPLVSEIRDKRVLDVGLGSGHYTKVFMEQNEVVGVDRNPHLCKLPIKVYCGDATELSSLVGEKRFDVVIATWLTEYLTTDQLEKFFSESKTVLRNNGELMTTVISTGGMGFLYIKLAKIVRGIDKYNYTKSVIVQKIKEAGFADVEIIDLDSWFGFPWAYMVVAR